MTDPEVSSYRLTAKGVGAHDITDRRATGRRDRLLIEGDIS
jgi:hypothetical protein